LAAGDKSFQYLVSGSTVTSAATAHNLFGSYGGLSDLSASEVIFVTIFASGGGLRISADPAVGATDDVGLRLTTAGSNYDLPPMKVTHASQITFARETDSNPNPLWTIWVRRPL